jgi:metal-responsive CopG/Arc/MetJ family transcriptional regulator
MKHSAVGWPRPEKTAGGKTMIGLRVDGELLDALDAWIMRQPGALSRQDAIRRIVIDHIAD